MFDNKLYQQAYYQRNRDRVLENVRQYRVDNLDKVRAYDRRRGLTSARRELNTARRLADPQKFNASVSAAKAKKPEKYRDMVLQQTQKRRAKQKDVFVEDVILSILYERDSGACGLCEKPVEYASKYPDLLSPSIDHVIPISRGGAHSYANTQLAHLGCNIRKGAG
jgi:5-methylcytosine-specific restriction endonuclease McrA